MAGLIGSAQVGIMEKHGNVRIANNCKLKYKPDQIYVTHKILEKVPEKFLVGLGAINFYDDRKDPIVKYAKGKPFSTQSRIDVFMGGFASSQKYSLMHFNMVMNSTIVNHIVSYLQPSSRDNDILSYRSGRYNRNWLYLGMWSPLLAPINLGRLLYRKVSFFRLCLDKAINNLLRKFAKAPESPFDVPGVKTKATTEDILDAIGESRERRSEPDV